MSAQDKVFEKGLKGRIIIQFTGLQPKLVYTHIFHVQLCTELEMYGIRYGTVWTVRYGLVEVI